LPHTLQLGCIDILIHKLASPSGRNVNYNEIQLSWGVGGTYELFYPYRFRKYVSYGFPIINFW
jgi:hypothetical protein